MPVGGETGRFADIRWRDETDSTNADLLALARAGAPEGVVIVTDHQRRGRGRRGRTWVAPPGSALLASVLVRPPLAPAAAHLVTMAAALAAAEACAEVAGVRPGLKWPNDLVIEGAGGSPRSAIGGGSRRLSHADRPQIGPGGLAKLAGLLGESLVEGDRLVAVVAGMGCNLRAATVPDPPLVEDRGGSATPIVLESAQEAQEAQEAQAAQAGRVAGAAYLEDLAGRPVDRDELLASWLAHLDARYPAPSRTSALLEDYRRRCTTLGRGVRVELAGESFEGRAVDLTDLGHLLVETVAGTREVAAGEVVHVRPAAQPF